MILLAGCGSNQDSVKETPKDEQDQIQQSQKENGDALEEKIKEIFADEDKYKEVSENAYRDLYVTWDKAVEKAYADYERIIQSYRGEKND